MYTEKQYGSAQHPKQTRPGNTYIIARMHRVVHSVTVRVAVMVAYIVPRGRHASISGRHASLSGQRHASISEEHHVNAAPIGVSVMMIGMRSSGHVV
jgi:hypothetical protein